MPDKVVGTAELVVKVSEHDRHLDTLSHAIEELSVTTKEIVTAINMQNVLIEKVNNMDKNVADSFARRDARLDALEKVQLSTGCAKVQVAHENIQGLGRSVDRVRDELHATSKAADKRMETMEDKIGTFISGTVVRWAIGIMLTLLLVVVSVNASKEEEVDNEIRSNSKEINRLDKLAGEKINMQRELNKHNKQRFDRIEKTFNRYIPLTGAQ